MTTGLTQALRLLEPFASRDGVYFDILIGGLDRAAYDRLPGVRETLTARRGELVWAKDVHLVGGSVTVECADRVAGRRAA